MQNNPTDDDINPNPVFPVEQPAVAPVQFDTVQSAPSVAENTQFQPQPALEPQPVVEPQFQPQPQYQSHPQVEPQPQPQLETQPEQAQAPVTSQFFPAAASSEIPAGPIGSGPLVDASIAAQPAKKSKKKLIILGGIIAGALIVFGGGSALAYNLWYQNPEKIVIDSVLNAFTAKTVQSTGSFDVKNSEYEAKVTFDTKSADKKSELGVKVEYTAAGQTFKLDGAGQFSTDGDLYVKVNNVNSIISAITGGAVSDSAAFKDLATKIEGKWIKITSDDIGTFSEEYKKTQVCLEDVTKQVTNDKKLSNEIFDLYKKNKFIVIKESLGARTINGVGSLGNVVDVDTAKVKTFATGLESTEAGKKLKACDGTINFKDFADSFDTSNTDSTKGEGTIQLWASRFGHELTEINANGKSDGTELKAVFNPVFNKAVTIETPSDPMTVESLKAEFEKATQAYTDEYYSTLYS